MACSVGSWTQVAVNRVLSPKAGWYMILCMMQWQCTDYHKGAFFGEPFWNENTRTWNGFLVHFFITWLCSHSGKVRMVVYSISCFLLFRAEWTEWAECKSCLTLGHDEMADQNNYTSVANWNHLAKLSLRKKQWSVFSPLFFWMIIVFFCFLSFPFYLLSFQKRPRKHTLKGETLEKVIGDLSENWVCLSSWEFLRTGPLIHIVCHSTRSFRIEQSRHLYSSARVILLTLQCCYQW